MRGEGRGERRRMLRGEGFRAVEEVAVAAGRLLPADGQGRHLRALAAWRAAVGQRVQQVTRVEAVTGDVLRVAVRDADWSASLHSLSGEILRRFRRDLGTEAPRRLELRIRPGFWRPGRRLSPRQPASAPGPAPAPVAEPRPSPPPQGPLPDPRREGGLLAAADVPVADPALQQRLRQVAGRYLARGGRPLPVRR